MRALLRAVLPILIVVGCVLIARYLIATKPQPAKFDVPATPIRVEAQTLQPRDYKVSLASRGTVQPRIESTFLPEVPGRIIEVSPSFYEGAFFEEGEVLVTLDPLDYRAAVTVAEGNVASAQAELLEEEARASQAEENWRKLGKDTAPSDLVLRKPQLARAKASVAAAAAQLEKARRDLERSRIRAPYTGRILTKDVDIGHYVTSGTRLATAYAVDFVEVRLPLSSRQLAFVSLPEKRRGGKEPAPTELPAVTLTGEAAGHQHTWQGRVIRVEGALDSLTRQLFVVAQVDDPYAPSPAGRPPLKIGLFVDARIEGVTLRDVLVLPRHAVRADNEIILIDPATNTIVPTTIEPLFTDDEHVVIAGGGHEAAVQPGAILCLTPITFPAAGAPVIATIDGVEPEPATAPDGRSGPPPSHHPH
jgi:RND family efflux transporter MFP subunit